MSDIQHEMAQALHEKAWIEDRLNECRQRNDQGIPISIGDIETLLMMALDQGRALQIGLPIIQDIDRLLDEQEILAEKLAKLEKELAFYKAKNGNASVCHACDGTGWVYG